MTPSYNPRTIPSEFPVRGDFHINEWLIQPQLHAISREAQVTHVEPKAMQVLVYLAGHADEVVTKERLISAVWADTFVTDDVLTRCISELRKAFDDDAKNQRVIQTIPRGGYRLVAPVRTEVVELTPARLRARRWSIAFAAILALALLAVALDIGGISGRLWRPKAAAEIQSLVVLPLENLSRDPEQEYFADGITEELITNLTKINALHVISRTSAVHYRGSAKTLPQIAQELGVDAVIEGAVQRSGDRVRVSAQLVEGRTDRHLWANSYERDLRDVLTLEGDVARDIAREIRLKLTPQEDARLVHVRPVNPDAHEAYLKGLYYWNKLTEKDVNKSITYFEESIRLAPDFAPAYAGLAFSYNLLASSEYVAPKDAYLKAKRLARKALELDENLAGAHAALGFALCFSDWDWLAAEAEFKRANELEPNGEGGHSVYALFLGNMGRHQEAVSELKKDLELDPLSVLSRWNLGCEYWVGAEFGPATEQFEKILEIAPNSPDEHQGLGIVYTLQRRYAEAIPELQKAVTISPDNAWFRASLGYVYAAEGNQQAAQQVLADLKQLSKRKYVSPYLIATVYSGLGDKDSAFHWLEIAFGERDDLLVTVKVDPMFASLRSDARFATLLRRIGLP